MRSNKAHRLLALLLAFVMTFSLLPTMAWAADNDCSAADDGSVTWSNDPLNAAMGIVPVAGITLDKSELSLTAGGETATLTATVLPEDAMDKTVTWTSSNETVATVSDGIVTPVSEGETDITVTTVEGSYTDTCKVTVSAQETVKISNIQVNYNFSNPVPNYKFSEDVTTYHMLQAVTLRQHALCKTACLTFKVRRSRFFAITAKV